MGESIKGVFKMNLSVNKEYSFQKGEKERFDAIVRMLPSGELRMTLEPWSTRKEKEFLRTQAQNNYYHKLLDIICDYTGDTHLELHDKFKAKFLGKPYVLEDKEYIIVPSTTSLNSKNFGEYLEKIFAFVGENYELILPSPSDYY